MKLFEEDPIYSKTRKRKIIEEKTEIIPKGRRQFLDDEHAHRRSVGASSPRYSFLLVTLLVHQDGRNNILLTTYALKIARAANR